MKKCVSVVLYIVLFVFSIWVLAVVFPFDYTKVPATPLFSNSVNDAQKLANFVFANGRPSDFNTGSLDEGVRYDYNVYIDNKIYAVRVLVYKNGDKNLSIDHYRTNVPFDRLKTPADIVAHELIYGRPKNFSEQYTHDEELDMKVDIFQVFEKRNGSGLESFTREERDDIASGVQEYRYDGGSEFLNGVWVAAPQETIDEIDGYYKEILSEILKNLEDK